MSIETAPPPLIVAVERLRQAEAQVDALRRRLALLPRPSAEHATTLDRLAASERSRFNRRLELEALQRERRRAALVDRQSDFQPDGIAR